jgi:hypothetical protein
MAGMGRRLAMASATIEYRLGLDMSLSFEGHSWDAGRNGLV